MKEVLLKILPQLQPGLSHKEIVEQVKPHLPAELFPGGEKAAWWSKTVQLDLEAKGLIFRVPSKPLTWYKK